jgi:hypothetical protein
VKKANVTARERQESGQRAKKEKTYAQQKNKED